MGPQDGLAGLMLTLGSGLVFALAIVLLLHKMIDGELPFLPGIAAIFLCVGALGLAVKAPNQIISGVVLVVAVTLMAFLPFAAEHLERVELRAIHVGRMAKAYAAVGARPDNYAANFELAQLLYAAGFQGQAIALSSSTLEGLSSQKDEVRNRSMRDIFYKEDILLKRWNAQAASRKGYACPSCGKANEIGTLFCAGCSRPYLLDIVSGEDLKPRVWGKLVLGFGILVLALPGAVALALSFEGALRIGMFVGAFVVCGLVLGWLFRPPKVA